MTSGPLSLHIVKTQAMSLRLTWKREWLETCMLVACKEAWHTRFQTQKEADNAECKRHFEDGSIASQGQNPLLGKAQP